MPLKRLQAALIEVFQARGQPKAIKVDNGRPFGDPRSDGIPPLALWLIGLDIAVVWNRPRRPTENAKVERMQSVTANWAEPNQCATVGQLQAHLDQATHIQRCQYRCRRLGNRTRTEVYPALLAPGRAYQAEGFDLRRVHRFMSQGQWVRKVSKQGQVSFYGHRWQVGQVHSGQQVCLHLDGQSWVIADEAGDELKRIPDRLLTAENLWSLSLSQGTERDTT